MAGVYHQAGILLQTEMMVRRLLWIGAFLFAFRVEAAVLRFDTAEIVLHSAVAYDNPFTDVQLTAQVTAPSGRKLTLDGFFDGGDVFKVRVFADETGAWSWTTQSNDADLNGQSGSFTVSGTLPGAFGKGPIVADSRYFKHRQGSAVYLVGKYLDRAAPVPIRYSHTMFSEERTDADRQALLDRHLGMGLNKINVYLANHTDYSSISTTPWLGTADANDKTRFDPERWQMYEQWVRKMRDAGVVTQLWFFADGFGNLPDADRQRLIRYGMARLSGYANTLFTLVTEWQEGWTAAEVDTHMVYLQQKNPWDRLATVHGTPGDFSFPNASWADYIDLQAGVSATVTHQKVHDLGIANRQKAVKPLIQEEFCMGDETDAARRMLWAAFTSGAAGSGTGAYLKPFSQFVKTVPFERMAPSDDLVVTGAAYVLGEEGASYVAYLYEGGTVALDLTAVSGTIEVDWFDPRTGAFLEAPSVSGGAARSFTAPGEGDWTLRLTVAEAPPPPPPPTGDFHTAIPCRLWDTRIDGPAFSSGEVREFDVTGLCGIPDNAVALSLNVTAIQPSGGGQLTLGPAGDPVPPTSTVSFRGGRDQANNALLKVSSSQALQIAPSVAGGGTVHLVLDVNGWFE